MYVACFACIIDFSRNRSCVLSMPPPLSLRETWEEVEKARKEADDDDSDSNDDL